MRFNHKLATLVALTFITLLGGFFRFWQNTSNPPSLTGDEIAFGYSAYSVLKTLHDENGKFLPITFQSIGDFKNPLPAYLMIPSIYLFGLNDFALRFQNALIGTLTIPIFFLFLQDLFKKKSVSLTGSLLLAISPWHIFYSRFAYEPAIAATFTLLGIWFFIKMLDGSKLWAYLSALFLALTMYTAFAPRLFIVVFTLSALMLNFKFIKTHLATTTTFFLSGALFSIPLAYASIFLGAGTRFSMVFIGNDIDFSRYVILKNNHGLKEAPYLFFYWAKRYLSYIQPNFLFLNGLGATAPNTIGLGLFYIYEIPFLIWGTLSFFYQKIPHKSILIIWLLAGLIPDSLTNNQQHSGRLLHIAPVLIIFIALGTVKFFNWTTKIKSKILKILIFSPFIILIILTLSHAFLTFSVHFPKAKGESFDEGLREVVYFINEHGKDYKEIVIDPRHGIEGPYIISNPQLYILFYTKYDPLTYQTEQKTFGTKENPYYKFGKFVIRHINWQIDRGQLGTLFVGSPWSIPESDLEPGELLKKIYLSNNSPAYFIVTPK